MSVLLRIPSIVEVVSIESIVGLFYWSCRLRDNMLSCRYKLGSHLALLQAAQTPGYQEIGSQDHVTFTKSLEFAKVALDSVVDQLPGQSYIRRDGIMDDHFALSGKLKVLDKLLDNFSHENAKVLVFSQSTESLDLIQNYLKSKGHSFLRMDGKTQNSLRQDLADKFNNDPTVFVFLLSTKAMGVGLNLTSASKVSRNFCACQYDLFSSSPLSCRLLFLM